MSPSVTISAWAAGSSQSVTDVVHAVRKASNAGFEGVWLPQTFGVDALTALAVAGNVVPDIPIGTAVVPIQGRHPIPLAQQALTTAQAAGAQRFSLGIGVTHPLVSEGCYGIPYAQTVGLCREVLEVLVGLLGPERRIDYEGNHLTARGTLNLDVPTPSLVVAALAPKMLELAGTFADGTVTWMTGPSVLRTTIVPAITEAASRAGRTPPRVIAGLPVCVTDDVKGARDRIRPRIEGMTGMPSYRRQLTQEGLEDLADLAIIGDRDSVAERVLQLGELGVTELLADAFGTADEAEATAAALTSLTSPSG